MPGDSDLLQWLHIRELLSVIKMLLAAIFFVIYMSDLHAKAPSTGPGVISS